MKMKKKRKIKENDWREGRQAHDGNYFNIFDLIFDI
jgi:hypothetical protein